MARRTTNDKTLQYFRNKGLLIGNVERFNAFSGRKSDLFYIMDFIAISDKETIAIQSCGSDFAPHVVKLFVHERENTVKWLSNPSRSLILIGWRKTKMVRGGKRFTYTPRIWDIIYENNKLFYEDLTEHKKD